MKILLNKILNKIAREEFLVFLVFILFYLVFFLYIKDGVGQYWDWSFPYFKDQIGNFFSYKSFSWTELKNGSPLGYSSDYFFRLILSFFVFLKPELLHYLIYVALFTIGSYGIYLIFNKNSQKNIYLIILFAFVAYINPVIFYKFIAGHLDYIASYTLFIYFIYFLSRCYKYNFKGSLVVGLFLSFLGIQIQFYIFSFIFLILFILFNISKIRFKFHLLLMVFIPLLVNFFWIFNLLISQGLASVANTAKRVAFSGSSELQFLNIFNISFSQATLIEKFYSHTELIYFSLLFPIIVTLFLFSKTNKNNVLNYFAFLLVMIFASTGILSSLTIAPFSYLGAILREVGHFAPLIFLTALILLFELIDLNKLNTLAKISIIGFIFVFLILNIFKYQFFSSLINREYIRNELLEYKTILDNDHSIYRVLYYPFFSQYSFKNAHIINSNGSLLTNVGRDSFMPFSNHDYIENAIPPMDVKNSFQYILLQNRDITILKPFNIKYLFDFTNIYESNFEKYAPKESYDNNLNIIKNDPSFFPDLVKNSSGRLKQITKNIYEIDGYESRFSVSDALFQFSSEPSFEEVGKFDFENSNNVYTSDLLSKEVFQFSHSVYSIFNNLDKQITFSDNNIVISSEVNIPFDNEWKLLKGTEQLYKNEELYLNNELIKIIPDSQAETINLPLGINKFIFKSQQKNLISNPSFELGPWKQTVQDCNSFDSNPKISMDLLKEDSERNNILSLGAERHIACTSSNFQVTGGKRYIFSFDYQSSTESDAGFFIQFNDKSKFFDRGILLSNNNSWSNYKNEINVPNDATEATLYIYSYGNDVSKVNLVQYDNFFFEEIPSVLYNFQLVSSPNKILELPNNISFNVINPTKSKISIKSAKAPFILNYSETYNKNWKLYLITSNLERYKFNSQDHFKSNGFSNGWFIDVDKICKEDNLCTQNADGTYDMDLVVEFWPQRWFYVGLGISGLTLLGCVGYLLVTSKKLQVKRWFKKREVEK